MKRFWGRAVAAFSMLIAVGAAAQERPQVVAVNYPLTYFAERLLDGSADVVFPVPDGVDPSFWRPSISDISRVQSADLILLNGAGFATWVDRVSLPRSRLVDTSGAIKDQFIVTESITHSHGDGGEHSHEGLAAYIWLDPTLAAAQAEAIAQAIVSRNLAPPDEVSARLETLRDDLEALDQSARNAVSQIGGSVVITTHPRYQYFGQRYNLRIKSLDWEAGASPDAEQLAVLRDLKQQTGARILIWEAKPDAAALQAVSALGLENVVLPPLAHPAPDGTYLEVLAQALSDLSEIGQRINN